MERQGKEGETGLADRTRFHLEWVAERLKKAFILFR